MFGINKELCPSDKNLALASPPTTRRTLLGRSILAIKPDDGLPETNPTCSALKLSTLRPNLPKRELPSSCGDQIEV